MWMKKLRFEPKLKFLPFSVGKKAILEPELSFYPLVWMKKAIFGAKIKFLPTGADGESYVWTQKEIPTLVKIVPFIRDISL